MRFFLLLGLFFLAGGSYAAELTGLGGSDATHPVRIEAEVLQNLDSDIMEARGNVRAVWGERQMTANLVRYDRKKQELYAEGDVRIRESSSKSDLICESGWMNLADSTVTAKNAKLYLGDTGYSVFAKELKRTGANTFEAKEAVFTACDGSWPSWRVEAEELEVEIEGYLFGKRSVFYVESLPIAYLPVFFYPAKLKRQSGFLPPKVGHSSVNGYLFGTRYYWVVDESADVTIEAEYRTRMGLTEAVDLRYVTGVDQSGRLKLRHYRQNTSQEDAFDVNFDHLGLFSGRSVVDVHIDYTGDKELKRDYATDLLSRGISRLESHVSVSHAADPGSLYAYGRYTQSFTENQQTVLQTLPALGFMGRDFNLLGPLWARGDFDAARLWKEEGIWADRARGAGELLIDADFNGFGFTVGGGMRGNLYDLHEPAATPYGDGAAVKSAFFAEALAWAALERPFSGFVHVIEPRLKFLVQGEGRGDDTPSFDEFDDFGKKSVAEPSVETRLYDPSTGRVLAALDLSRELNLGETDGGRLFSEEAWGPWRGQFGINPVEGFSLQGEGVLEPGFGENDWHSWSLRVNASDERGDFIRAERNYLSGRADFMEISAKAELKYGWAVGYVNRFSIKDRKMLEDESRVVFRHQCWQAAVTFTRSYLPEKDLFDKVIMFNISLVGLGKLGSVEW